MTILELPYQKLPEPVLYNVMARELAAYDYVLRGFAGHQLGLASQVLTDDRGEGHGMHVIHHEATRLPAITVHQRQNLVLVVEAATLLHALRHLWTPKRVLLPFSLAAFPMTPQWGHTGPWGHRLFSTNS